MESKTGNSGPAMVGRAPHRAKRGSGGARFGRRALLAAGAAAFASPGGAPGVAAAPPRARQPQPLVFALQDSDAVRVAPLLVDYERERGGAVRLDPYPYEALLEKLTIDLTLGSGGIDLVSLDDPWLPRFAGADALLDLDAGLARLGQGRDADFVPALLALGEHPPGGGLRALPWVGNLQLFAWRADTLAELGLAPPRTWDDAVAVARAVTAKRGSSGLYGFGLRGRPGNPATTGFLPVLRGHGLDLFDDRWEPQLETAEALAALEILLALAELAPPGVAETGHEELGAALREGRIAQAADLWPDQLLRAFDPEQSVVARTLQVGAQPRQPGVAASHVTGTWLLGLPRGTRQPEAALDLLLWLTAPERQRRLLYEASIPPTRTSVLQDPQAVARYPFLPALLAAAPGARPRPRTPLYAAVEAICGRYLAEAIAGRLRAEEALVAANRELRALMVREGMLAP